MGEKRLTGFFKRCRFRLAWQLIGRYIRICLGYEGRDNRLLTKPVKDFFQNISPLKARGDRPLSMTFKDQPKALIYFYG